MLSGAPYRATRKILRCARSCAALRMTNCCAQDALRCARSCAALRMTNCCAQDALRCARSCAAQDPALRKILRCAQDALRGGDASAQDARQRMKVFRPSCTSGGDGDREFAGGSIRPVKIQVVTTPLYRSIKRRRQQFTGDDDQQPLAIDRQIQVALEELGDDMQHVRAEDGRLRLDIGEIDHVREINLAWPGKGHQHIAPQPEGAGGGMHLLCNDLVAQGRIELLCVS